MTTVAAGLPQCDQTLRGCLGQMGGHGMSSLAEALLHLLPGHPLGRLRRPLGTGPTRGLQFSEGPGPSVRAAWSVPGHTSNWGTSQGLNQG